MSDKGDEEEADEADILREMIADREHRIVLIKHKNEEQLEKEERLNRELDEVQQLTTNQKIDRATDRTRLLHDKQRAQKRLESMQRDLQQQSSSLQAYGCAATGSGNSGMLCECKHNCTKHAFDGV
jgi:hypothetical protein